MKLENIIEKFIEYIEKELNYTLQTKENYKRDLICYKDFLNENKINYITINKIQILDYLKYLAYLKYSNKTISRHLSTLRSFYNYLMEIGEVKTNIFNRIRNPKIEKKLPNYLNIVEIEEILESIDEETKEDIRDKFLLELLY